VDYIIYFSEKINKSVTNLRLNILLFFIQKESIIRNNQPAFDDESKVLESRVKIPSIYYSFSHYDNIPIIRITENININEKSNRRCIN
jgi:uncharacterized phage-associated protein